MLRQPTARLAGLLPCAGWPAVHPQVCLPTLCARRGPLCLEPTLPEPPVCEGGEIQGKPQIFQLMLMIPLVCWVLFPLSDSLFASSQYCVAHSFTTCQFCVYPGCHRWCRTQEPDEVKTMPVCSPGIPALVFHQTPSSRQAQVSSHLFYEPFSGKNEPFLLLGSWYIYQSLY